MRRSFVALSGILWAVTFSLPAREPPAGRGNQFFDSLLDHLVGDWHVTRKFASGRMAENAVHAEWVLNHQFMELHFWTWQGRPNTKPWFSSATIQIRSAISAIGSTFLAVNSRVSPKVTWTEAGTRLSSHSRIRMGNSPIDSHSIRNRRAGHRSCARKLEASGSFLRRTNHPDR